MPATRTRLVICAKSSWDPSIRREHHFARAAVQAGIEVVFLEAPSDVRALATAGRRSYVRGFGSSATLVDGVRVIPTSVLVPGHRGRAAAALATASLRRRLAAFDDADTVVVGTAPWYWPAISGLSRACRVVDLADDWAALIPQRADFLDELHRRIGAEADAVVLASGSLSAKLARSEPVVVPNATADALVEMPTRPAPETRSMTYVGTLSERFDADLMSAVLALLPDWTLDLWGPCQYAGRVLEPGDSLVQLINTHPGRVGLRGTVTPVRLADALDAADVLVIPNVASRTGGQDSMKLYDYLARGRPVVTTAPVDPTAPGVRVGANAQEFAAAVLATLEDGSESCAAQRAWAASNTYGARWPAWWAAASGGRLRERVS